MKRDAYFRISRGREEMAFLAFIFVAGAAGAVLGITLLDFVKMLWTVAGGVQ